MDYNAALFYRHFWYTMANAFKLTIHERVVLFLVTSSLEVDNTQVCYSIKAMEHSGFTRGNGIT